MNEPDLNDLLHRADGLPGGRSLPAAALAARARQLALRRLRRRAVMMAACPLLIAVAVVALTAGRHEKPRVAVLPHGPATSPAGTDNAKKSSRPPEAADRKGSEPSAPADLIAAAWLGSRQPRRYAAMEIPDDAPPRFLSEQIDQAASTIVTFADRSAADPSEQADAVQQYQAVIDLFPQTTWANVAREQLARLRRPGS